MTSTQTLNTDAKNFDWWLDNFVESSFVESSAGVHDAVAVAADGILVAMSQSVDRAGAERLAATFPGSSARPGVPAGPSGGSPCIKW